MWSEFRYINIREVLSRVMRHPLMSSITLEYAIQYTLDFIGIMGLPKVYEDKKAIVKIEMFRGVLPCDCVMINQVRDCKSGVCLRAMTDNFPGTHKEDKGELSFKTQGAIIYTSFKKGEIEISYKGIHVDDEGLPMLPDNAVFLKALEAYIKKEWFTVLFDLGKIQLASLQNTQQQYAWLAGQLQSEFTIPSVSEMESFKRSWCTLIQRTTSFNDGFRNNGNQEYIKLQ